MIRGNTAGFHKGNYYKASFKIQDLKMTLVEIWTAFEEITSSCVAMTYFQIK